MFAFSNIFKTKPFDFEEYLDERAFVLKYGSDEIKVYVNDVIRVTIFNENNINNKKVIIDVLLSEVASFSFIPKSRTMLDILLNQIRIDLIEKD